jgi:GAF domain-containing protein
MTREARILRTFVELADNLVEDFDVVELLTVLADRCVEVLGVDAAGIMLAATDAPLRVIASSSDAMRELELFEIQAEEGPCLDCHRTGLRVSHLDLSSGTTPWPQFAGEAVAAGYLAVNALPMRLRGATIGALNLFDAVPPGLPPEDLDIAQSFADVATIAVLQDRAHVQAQRLNEQLQGALTSRIIIEQAKGMVAESRQLSIDVAFDELRRAARSSNTRLGDFAAQVVDGRRRPGTFELTT